MFEYIYIERERKREKEPEEQVSHATPISSYGRVRRMFASESAFCLLFLFACSAYVHVHITGGHVFVADADADVKGLGNRGVVRRHHPLVRARLQYSVPTYIREPREMKESMNKIKYKKYE